MPPEERRRRKPPRWYEIIIVPNGVGKGTKRFRSSAQSLVLMALATILLFGGAALVLLMYTPLAMYIPIKNPELEQKYGREIADTQRRLNSLAEDVLLLRDYNSQLRKALGDTGKRDTLRRESEQRRGVEPTDLSSAGWREPFPGEESGADFTGTEAFTAVITNVEGFRAAFPLLQPVAGIVTQLFDPSRRHFGLDYAIKEGTPVHATTDGYVIFAGWTYEDGNMMILSHGGGYLTVYKHNQSLFKSAQEFVRRGELIALSGSTGKTSLGPHLHFEVWKDGVPQDPQEFLLTTPHIQ